MGNELDRRPVRFEPLRAASRGRVVAAFVLGPVLWLLALTVVALVSHHSSAIALGLLVAVASFVVSLLALALLRAARVRREERYANHR
jgi:hypothetical protein